MAKADAAQGDHTGTPSETIGAQWAPRQGAQWGPRRGAQWAPARRRALVGTSFLALASLLGATFTPVTAVDSGPEIQLLEAQWDAAAPLTVNNGLGIIEYSVATEDTNEAEAAVILQSADLELSGATEAFSEVTVEANPYAGTSLEPYYTPKVIDAPSIEDEALVAALHDAEQKLDVVEQVLVDPTATEAEIVQANDQLAASLDDADKLITEAAVDATPEQLAELEVADDALNGAVAVVNDVVDADQSWISDLAGWTPNIRYAIDRRGPKRRLSGAGIDVAIIDSGVTPVQGLHGDKVINGPDLSADGLDPATANIDLYGHGTHLAGIIAGNDGGTPVPGQAHFTGIAPDARLVTVKVADGDGGPSIAQIVAVSEWVFAKQQANGLYNLGATPGVGPG